MLGNACVFPENAKRPVLLPEHAVCLDHRPRSKNRVDSTSQNIDAQSYDSNASETTAQLIEKDGAKTDLGTIKNSDSKCPGDDNRK